MQFLDRFSRRFKKKKTCGNKEEDKNLEKIDDASIWNANSLAKSYN